MKYLLVILGVTLLVTVIQANPVPSEDDSVVAVVPEQDVEGGSDESIEENVEDSDEIDPRDGHYHPMCGEKGSAVTDHCEQTRCIPKHRKCPHSHPMEEAIVNTCTDDLGFKGVVKSCCKKCRVTAGYHPGINAQQTVGGK